MSLYCYPPALTKERIRTISGVAKVIKAVEEGTRSSCCIIAAIDVAKERKRSSSHIVFAEGIAKSAPALVAVFRSAVLAGSVPPPVAVLKSPSVLPLSEKKPTAVL